MTSTIQSTQLDFQAIKQKLKTFLAAQPEFTDYNFEAAGLSNILDVLAWNTHFNGLAANFALNESFLTTSQLRSSVVSHAELLGYTPRSRIGSVAFVNLSITNTALSRSPQVVLPAYTTFTGIVDGASYSFQTLEPYTATDNGIGVYNFQTSDGSFDIPIKEGRLTSKTFYVGEASGAVAFVIPDVNMDKDTLDVKVFESPSSSSFTTYGNIKQTTTIDSQSTLFNISEAPNGFWQLHFSDGITTGVAPVAGNKINVTYISCSGEDANGATGFIPSSTVTMDSTQYTMAVTVAAVASGGANKESIESIKQNAPLMFASQQRLVTASDYRTQILSTFGSVRDCIAWGGEDNVPPEYGKVFVSLMFQDGVTDDVKLLTKNAIVSQLSDNLAIMSIDTKFLDPQIIYIGCQTTFNYNPNKSTTSIGIAESQVLALIQSYFSSYLGIFGGPFRRSNLTTEIDSLSEAILDTRMDITTQIRFTPYLGRPTSYSLVFPFALAAPSNTAPVITSNSFLYGSTSCSINNHLGSNKLQVVSSTGVVVVDNVGSYEANTGVITLVGFEPSNIPGSTEIKLNAQPANQGTVKPSRNYVLQLDLGTSFATGVLDFENSQTGR